MKKQRVIYEIKNKDNTLIQKSKIFDDVASACNFFNEIKSISVSKPIIEDFNQTTNGE
jgi:hypothetical protein